MGGRGRQKGTYRHSEDTRQKIKTAWLIHRLQMHVAGKFDLSPTQVRAIDILLKKVMPDLVSADITADVNFHYVAELPPTLELDEWQRRYGPTALLTDETKVQ
jgi:hypothetical protein